MRRWDSGCSAEDTTVTDQSAADKPQASDSVKLPAKPSVEKRSKRNKKKEKEKDKIEVTRWSTFENDEETLQCTVPYLFTAGDSATGPDLVVSAIGGGRRAARSIHRYLNEEEVIPVPNSLRKKHIPESLFDSVDGVTAKTRTPMPELEVKERITSMVEVDLVITEKDAKYESSRCLGCCRICTNKDEEAAVATEDAA